MLKHGFDEDQPGDTGAVGLTGMPTEQGGRLLISGLISGVRHWSLSTKFLLTALLISMLPVCALSTMHYYTLSSSLQEEANAALLDAARQTAEDLDQWFKGNRFMLERQSRLPVIVGFLDGGIDRARALATLQVLGDRQGDQTISYALTDPAGRTLLDSAPSQIDALPIVAEVCQQAIARGHVQISPVLFDHRTRIARLLMASPVRSSDGRLLGTVRAMYSSDVIQHQVELFNSFAGRSSYAMLINRDGLILADGQWPEQRYQLVIPVSDSQLSRLVTGNRVPGHTRLGVRRLDGIEQVIDGVDPRQPYLSLHDSRHATQRLSGAAVSMRSVPWVVVFVQPHDVLMAPVNRQLQQALMTGAVTAVLAVIASALLTQILVRPLIRLTETTHAIADGDLTVPVNTHRSDELGLLAKSIARMRDSIRCQMEELREGEARYRSLLENLNTGVIRTNMEGRILHANRSAAQIAGCRSVSELMQSDMSAFYLDQADRKTLHDLLLTEGQVRDMQMQVRRHDGRMIHVNLSSNLLRNAEGRPLYIDSTVDDVTDQVAYLRERERLINELEAKNTELERFTYTVSHDLRSPLTTIKGFVRYLGHSAKAGKWSEFEADIKRIEHATEKMSNLLGDLLELSRIGRLANPTGKVDLNELVADALALLQSRIVDSGVQVTVDAGLPTVTGDRVRLLQVYQNLIENATKFMGDTAERRIHIGLENFGGGKVLFVADNGIGIAAENQQAVFDLFHKLDGSAEGTGIGLSLVKKIIEVHGGWIQVYSEGRGTGTRFRFTLGQDWPEHNAESSD